MKVLNKLFISLFAISLLFNPSLFSSDVTNHEEIISIEETADGTGFLATIRCDEEIIQTVFPEPKIEVERHGTFKIFYCDIEEDLYDYDETYAILFFPFKKNLGTSPTNLFFSLLLKEKPKAIDAIIDLLLALELTDPDEEEVEELRESLKASDLQIEAKQNGTHTEYWVRIPPNDSDDNKEDILFVLTQNNIYFLHMVTFTEKADAFIEQFKVTYE